MTTLDLGRTLAQNDEIRAAVAKSLRSLSTATVGADTIRAELRATIRGLFPAEPTRAAIDAVTSSPLWKGIMEDAQTILGETYFAAPRYLDGKAVDLSAARVAVSKSRKEAASLSDDDKRLRRAALKYRDNAVKQNITDCIPAAVDEAKPEAAGVGAGAGKAEAEAVAVDPSAILAAVDAWLATNPGKTLVDNFFREVAKRQPK